MKTNTETPYGYLMASFTGEHDADSEQVYFSISRDGLHFSPLNQQKPVLKSHVGTRGVRDPFLFRTQGGEYVLLATDLRMYDQTEPDPWRHVKVAGSNNLIVWHSKDLLTWSDEQAIKLGSNFGCVWAPEAIYDSKYQNYRVFWSSTEKTEVPAKLRIYSATTTDFERFTEPSIYLSDPTYDTIDLDVVADGDYYYRFWKLEEKNTVVMDRVKHLDDPGESVPSPYLKRMQGVEGPQAYQLPDGQWMLLLDQINKQHIRAYVPAITKTASLAGGEFIELAANDYRLPPKPRHGSVMPLTQRTYIQVINRWA